MRKFPSIALILGTLLIASCGGSDDGNSEAASPLDNALGYLPADAPFAVSIDTDTNGDQFDAAEKIADRFPFGDQLRDQLEDAFGGGAGDLDRIRKALGNEFVVGSTDANAFVNLSGGDDTRFVGAIEAKSEDALDDLLKQEKLEEDGESNGAKLYKDDSGDLFAVDGDTLVVAGSKRQLEQALETRDGDDRLTEDDFDAGTEGVPDDALLRVYLDVAALLRESPAAKDALDVKWVKALRTAGIALSFADDRMTVDFDLRTDPAGLTAADLPIAPGGAAPQVLDGEEGGIGIALRDPAHVLEFAQATAKAIDPSGFGQFAVAKAVIERRAGVSLDDDVIRQLDGDLAVGIAPDGSFGARAEVKDPAKLESSLAELSDVLPDIVAGAIGEDVELIDPKAPGDLYTLTTSSGDDFAFGVVDGVFVLSNDPATAVRLPDLRTVPVRGAKGALVIDASAEQLVRTLLDQIDDRLGIFADLADSADAIEPLDDLTGSIEASRIGLSGSFELTLDK